MDGCCLLPLLIVMVITSLAASRLFRVRGQFKVLGVRQTVQGAGGSSRCRGQFKVQGEVQSAGGKGNSSRCTRQFKVQCRGQG